MFLCQLLMNEETAEMITLIYFLWRNWYRVKNNLWCGTSSSWSWWLWLYFCCLFSVWAPRISEVWWASITALPPTGSCSPSTCFSECSWSKSESSMWWRNIIQNCFMAMSSTTMTSSGPRLTETYLCSSQSSEGFFPHLQGWVEGSSLPLSCYH